jgi:hypothetical protein
MTDQIADPEPEDAEGQVKRKIFATEEQDSPDLDDTEGHGRPRYASVAGEDEDDVEGHARKSIV